MKKTAQIGFTLIELLVVMAIIGILGVFTLANFSGFGETKKLDNAVLDIQSILRTAQSNATSNVQCTQFSAVWQVEFSADGVTTNLKCQNPLPTPLPTPPLPTPVTKKTSQFDTNISIQSVLQRMGTNCPTSLPFTVSFAPITGNMTIGSSSACQEITLILRNSKANVTKTLNIDRGGRIYAD